VIASGVRLGASVDTGAGTEGDAFGDKGVGTAEADERWAGFALVNVALMRLRRSDTVLRGRASSAMCETTLSHGSRRSW
jgi:hypothetical protein